MSDSGHDSDDDPRPDFERNDDDVNDDADVKPATGAQTHGNSDDEKILRPKRSRSKRSRSASLSSERSRSGRRSYPRGDFTRDEHRQIVRNEREDNETSGLDALVLRPNQKTREAPEGSGPIKKSTKARNKMFMGNLLGHLAKAKTGLEKERDTQKRRLQEETEERVVVKLREERKTIAEQRQRDEALRRLQAREMQFLNQRLNKHYNHMRNFIRTKSEPTIFFLPKKHNPVTLQLLQDTRDDIDRKLEILKEDLQVNDTVWENNYRPQYGYGTGQIASSRDIAAEGKRSKKEY